jgi:hypothetical protein
MVEWNQLIIIIAKARGIKKRKNGKRMACNTYQNPTIGSTFRLQFLVWSKSIKGDRVAHGEYKFDPCSGVDLQNPKPLK